MLRNPYNPNDIAENFAFTVYAAHQQYVDDIVKQILSGETVIELNQELSKEDMTYIKKEVRRRQNE